MGPDDLGQEAKRFKVIVKVDWAVDVYHVSEQMNVSLSIIARCPPFNGQLPTQCLAVRRHRRRSYCFWLLLTMK